MHHTDAEREYAYDRKFPVGKLDKALDEAASISWTVVSIVVVRESTFQKLSDTPGLIYEEARRTGLLVYECES